MSLYNIVLQSIYLIILKYWFNLHNITINEYLLQQNTHSLLLIDSTIISNFAKNFKLCYYLN